MSRQRALRGADPYEKPEVVLRERGANLVDIPELAELC
jgi:hypothetical protein